MVIHIILHIYLFDTNVYLKLQISFKKRHVFCPEVHLNKYAGLQL